MHKLHSHKDEKHEIAPDFLSHEVEEVDDVLRLPGELLPEDGVLRGHAHGARVEVALSHHDAAHGDERGGGEGVLLGAKKCRDHNIAP